MDVEVDWGFDEKIKRKVLIYNFVVEGLIPFVNGHGYNFGCKTNEIVRAVAKTLYHGCNYHRNINDNYRKEDLDHYYYILEDSHWDSLWETWGHWCDVDEEQVRNRERIRLCAWSLLDLERSAQTRRVDEELGLYDEEDVDKKPIKKNDSDPYLQDAANGYFNPV